jgi:methylaspartate mutase sigma subunit
MRTLKTAQLACLLTTIPSDSHTWNLVYLELLLKELDLHTVNLGSCVPADMVIDAVVKRKPDFVVFSTLNGHGISQIPSVLSEMRRALGADMPPVVVGGELSTDEAPSAALQRAMLAGGVDAVFLGECAIRDFRQWLENFKLSRSPAALAIVTLERATTVGKSRT